MTKITSPNNTKQHAIFILITHCNFHRFERYELGVKPSNCVPLKNLEETMGHPFGGDACDQSPSKLFPF